MYKKKLPKVQNIDFAKIKKDQEKLSKKKTKTKKSKLELPVRDTLLRDPSKYLMDDNNALVGYTGNYGGFPPQYTDHDYHGMGDDHTNNFEDYHRVPEREDDNMSMSDFSVHSNFFTENPINTNGLNNTTEESRSFGSFVPNEFNPVPINIPIKKKKRKPIKLDNVKEKTKRKTDENQSKESKKVKENFEEKVLSKRKTDENQSKESKKVKENFEEKVLMKRKKSSDLNPKVPKKSKTIKNPVQPQSKVNPKLLNQFANDRNFMKLIDSSVRQNQIKNFLNPKKGRKRVRVPGDKKLVVINSDEYKQLANVMKTFVMRI